MSSASRSNPNGVLSIFVRSFSRAHFQPSWSIQEGLGLELCQYARLFDQFISSPDALLKDVSRLIRLVT
jgi:hypothetical protein